MNLADQLQKLAKTRESLYSEDGWSSQNVDQSCKWNVGDMRSVVNRNDTGTYLWHNAQNGQQTLGVPIPNSSNSLDDLPDVPATPSSSPLGWQLSQNSIPPTNHNTHAVNMNQSIDEACFNQPIQYRPNRVPQRWAASFLNENTMQPTNDDVFRRFQNMNLGPGFDNTQYTTNFDAAPPHCPRYFNSSMNGMRIPTTDPNMRNMNMMMPPMQSMPPRSAGPSLFMEHPYSSADRFK